jgi:hypothetical protein
MGSEGFDGPAPAKVAGKISVRYSVEITYIVQHDIYRQ